MMEGPSLGGKRGQRLNLLIENSRREENEMLKVSDGKSRSTKVLSEVRDETYPGLSKVWF
jgi:hypothetical protein